MNAKGGQITYQSSVPTVQDSYPSSGFGDDLSIAALWLGLAQNDSSLISQANGYFNQFQLAKQLPDSVFNWDSPLPGIPILGAQIFNSYPQLGGDGWQSQAEAYLDRLVSGKGAGKLTKGFGNLTPPHTHMLTEPLRWTAFLRRIITIGKLEPRHQRRHAFEKVLCDCDLRRQVDEIHGILSLLYLYIRIMLIQR